MRPELEKYQLASAYLNNELDAEAKANFEQAMNADPELQQFVQEIDTVNQVVSGSALFGLQAEMQNDLENWSLQDNTPKNNKSNTLKWVAAAVAGGAILATTLWYEENPKPVEQATPNQVEYHKDPVILIDSTSQEFTTPDHGHLPKVSETTPETQITGVDSLSPTLQVKQDELQDQETLVDTTPVLEDSSSSSAVVVESEDQAEETVEEVVECQLGWVQIPTSTPSCQAYPSGSIELSNGVWKNASGKVTALLLDETGAEVSDPEALPAGEYFISLEDEAGCAIMEKVSVTNVTCEVDFTYSVASLDQWTLDFPVSGPVQVTILAPSNGDAILDQEFASLQDFSWNGKSTNGNNLPLDMYVYIVRTSSSVIKGSITLVP